MIKICKSAHKRVIQSTGKAHGAKDGRMISSSATSELNLVNSVRSESCADSYSPFADSLIAIEVHMLSSFLSLDFGSQAPAS